MGCQIKRHVTNGISMQDQNQYALIFTVTPLYPKVSLLSLQTYRQIFTVKKSTLVKLGNCSTEMAGWKYDQPVLPVIPQAKDAFALIEFPMTI